jgi:hypothetical protein
MMRSILQGALIGAAVFGLLRVIYPHHDAHTDQCVICHPSGKLALWGECD